MHHNISNLKARLPLLLPALMLLLPHISCPSRSQAAPPPSTNRPAQPTVIVRPNASSKPSNDQSRPQSQPAGQQLQETPAKIQRPPAPSAQQGVVQSLDPETNAIRTPQTNQIHLRVAEILLDHDRFDQANKHFITALQSTNPQVQEAALKGIRETLEVQDRPLNWFSDQIFTPLFVGAIKGGLVLLTGLILWVVIEWFGKYRGRRRICVKGTNQDSISAAAAFETILKATMAERTQQLPQVLSVTPLAPLLIESAPPEANFPDFTFADVNIPFSTILKRALIPNYTVDLTQISTDPKEFTVLLCSNKSPIRLWTAQPSSGGVTATYLRIADQCTIVLENII